MINYKLDSKILYFYLHQDFLTLWSPFPSTCVVKLAHLYLGNILTWWICFFYIQKILFYFFIIQYLLAKATHTVGKQAGLQGLLATHLTLGSVRDPVSREHDASALATGVHLHIHMCPPRQPLHTQTTHKNKLENMKMIISKFGF